MKTVQMETKRVIFSKEEKDFLKQLILKHADIIESKKVDGETIKNKSRAWHRIEQEYNCNVKYNKRTAKQLKKLWDNIKCERKRQLAAAKERFLTGEGPPENPLELEDHVDSLLSISNFMYDSGTNLQPSIAAEAIEIPVEVLVEENGTHFDTPPANYTSTLERVKTVQPIPSRTRNTKREDYTDDEGVDSLKTAYSMKEHQKRMNSLMEEELQNKIKLSKLEIEAKEQELRHSDEAFRAEMVYKERRWKLELEILQKQLNK